MKVPSQLLVVAAFVLHASAVEAAAGAPEPLVIAASPSLTVPLEALGRAFEAAHPNVRVQIYYDSGLDLRRTVAAMENSMIGQYFIGRGPIHLVAPGGDELIDRLTMRYYILPGTKRPYAAAHLVMVVPESLVEAPSSFDAIARDARIRVAVADPMSTELGRQTSELFRLSGSHRGYRVSEEPSALSDPRRRVLHV